jgi:pimeloyl-ACP methyl ester carboxylesterase
MSFLEAAGHRLEYVWIGPPPETAPTIVFLHEGLGSISQWRDFPAAVCTATGCGGLVYNRLGHGASDPLRAPRPVHFMHDEALVALPAVLAASRIHRPVLLGHSDGGSIALIYAGANPGSVRGLVLEAPHVFVEDVSVESIARIRTVYETTDLRSRLARHHGANTDGVFYGWNDVWLRPAFRAWNVEEYLAGIDCPVLVVQGETDEYGSLRQVDAIAAATRGRVETLVLPRCGHAPHIDQRQTVEQAVVRFVRKRLLGAAGDAAAR